MVAHRLDMPFQSDVARRIVLRIDITLEGRERHLRVDHYVLPPGKVKYDVGTQVAAALLILDVVLQFVVLALAQARVLQQLRKDHLTPVALNLGVALQGVRQVRRLGRNLTVELHQPLEFVFQRAALLGLLRVDPLNTLAELAYVVLEGLEDCIHRLAVLLLEAAALLPQHIPRQGAELLPQRLLHLLLRAHLVRHRAALGLKVGLGLCPRHAFALALPARLLRLPLRTLGTGQGRREGRRALARRIGGLPPL